MANLKAVACLLVLPSCFTMQLWSEVPHREEVRTTNYVVRAYCAELRWTPEGGTIRVCMDVAGCGMTVVEWRPQAGLEDEFRDAVEGDACAWLMLHIVHWRPPCGNGVEWQARLISSAIGSASDVELCLAPKGAAPSAGVARALALHSVTWTEREKTTGVDFLEIGWRTAVTPWAVAADMVLVIPLCVAGLVIGLIEPAVLTGG